ncbi:MAG TPA: chemotaxis protein CheW [Gemmatimonadales bacterium]|nr:chemotaxis protein CheW [Gemmatimonadales bacterium]
MGDPTTVRLLLFRVGALLGAVAVEEVAEILPRLDTTRIPGAMPFVAGLVNVRGTLVTVVTGWRALGQPDGGPEGGASLVLLRLQGGRRLIGLTVDDVVDLVTVAPDDLQDRAALPGVDPVLVRAVGRRGSGSYVVLDTAALFAPVLAS